MKKPHKNAEVLKALANGEDIQYLYPERAFSPQVWYDFEHTGPLSPLFEGEIEWRVKPKTVCLNGIDIPRGISSVEKGNIYWTLSPRGPEYVAPCVMFDSSSQFQTIADGLAWANKEDAMKVMAAILKVLKPND